MFKFKTKLHKIDKQTYFVVLLYFVKKLPLIKKEAFQS